ncbi:hypothetical protein Dimus_018646 [Dionaea muscipula]
MDVMLGDLLGMDGGGARSGASASNLCETPMKFKRCFGQSTSPRSPLSAGSPHSDDSIDLAIDYAVDDSIDRLYNTICNDMVSSDQSCSSSMRSFTTFGNESRIDVELNRLVGVHDHIDQIEEAREVLKEVVVAEQSTIKEAAGNSKVAKQPNGTSSKKTGGAMAAKVRPAKSKFFPSKVMPSQSPRLASQALDKSNACSKSAREKPPLHGKKDAKISWRSNSASSLKNDERNYQKPVEVPEAAGLDNPDLGPYLLKKAVDTISSGDNPKKAFEMALRAKKSFEKSADGKPNLDFVMCLHLLASMYCSSGQHNQAIPLLERSIEIPKVEMGPNHALAKFAGCMKLGDIYAMLGKMNNSILFYRAGLEIQRHVLGEKDLQFGETCRYVAEAHVQALEFDEAEKLCQLALDIHKENPSTAMSLEEASDRRLMGLICDSKANHEAALQHYILASMAMQANGQETDKATIDCNVGDAYLSLSRYDEAAFSYQKALAVLKTSKGENHPAVASVYVRLAELYNKMGKFRDSKSFCNNAQRIYENPPPGIPSEEIASGLVNLAAIYESMQELEQALNLLQKGLTPYSKGKGQQSTMAAIEAQMGAIGYMLGNYSDSYHYFRSAVSKFQACGEKKSALCGIVLNQMGLACVQLCSIAEAAGLFEEARSILEQEYGAYHPDTLAVCSNLAGTYDALGR